MVTGDAANGSGTASTDPRVSVIIPAYNAETFIAATLRSASAQTVTSLEIIVVDDGSTDGTASIVERHDDARLRYVRQDNSGVSAARNAGLALARGDFVSFLDADDVLSPDAFERLLTAFDQTPEAVFAYGEGLSFSGETPDIANAAPQRPPIAARPEGDALAGFLVANPVRTSTAMARRHATQNTSGFPTHLRLGEDWAYWCELASLGPVIYVPGRPLVAYRRHVASATGSLATSVAAMAAAIDYVFQAPWVRDVFDPATLRRLRRASEASAFRFISQSCLKSGDWSEATRSAHRALSREPMSFRAWVFWACSKLRFLPAPLERRLA